MKLLFDREGQGQKIHFLCHFVASALHNGFKAETNFESDNYKFFPKKGISDELLESEIGNKYAGRTLFFSFFEKITKCHITSTEVIQFLHR